MTEAARAEIEGLGTLVVYYDDSPSSPREFDNLGTMVCFHRRYNLGDEHEYRSPEHFLTSLFHDLPADVQRSFAEKYATRLDVAEVEREENGTYTIWDSNGSEVASGFPTKDDALLYIEDEYEREIESIIDEPGLEELLGFLAGHYIMLPLYLYDHSGITMNTTGFSDPWDSGQVGVIYVDPDEIRKEWQMEDATNELVWEKGYEVLRAEVDEYDKYIQGEVYGYVLEDAEGNEVDSCWGFIGADWFKQALRDNLSKEYHPLIEEIDV